MTKQYIVRVVHGNVNNTFRVSKSALDAMMDLLTKQMVRGEVKAFSVEVKG